MTISNIPRAVLSPCLSYRYRLSRDIDSGGDGRVLFVMLNPSTADETKDDPTIRKCLGFARKWWSPTAIDVVNLYAWRATDPADLRRAADHNDVIGPETNAYVRAAAASAMTIVVAWGALNLGAMSGPARARAGDVSDMLAQTGKRLVCFGTTQGGQPRHPLMVAYATEAETWKGWRSR